MKNIELQKMLKEYPDDIEVSVGNTDIHFISQEPAYWDGCQAVLMRDESKKPYYDVTGVKYRSNGSKLCIRTLSLSDVIWNKHDAIVDVSEVSEHSKKWYTDFAEKVRKDAKRSEYENELCYFKRFVYKKLNVEETERYDKRIKDFFDACMSPEDPFPEDLGWQTREDGTRWLPSYIDRRDMQWDREIQIFVSEHGDLLLDKDGCYYER